MAIERLRNFVRRHAVWLLWLALLLPVAQLANAAHSLSHLHDEEKRNGDETSLHLRHCPTCTMAAVFTAGPPPNIGTSPVLRNESTASIAAQPSLAVRRAAHSLFSSRAPPQLLS